MRWKKEKVAADIHSRSSRAVTLFRAVIVDGHEYFHVEANDKPTRFHCRFLDVTFFEPLNDFQRNRQKRRWHSICYVWLVGERYTRKTLPVIELSYSFWYLYNYHARRFSSPLIILWQESVPVVDLVSHRKQRRPPPSHDDDEHPRCCAR